MKTFFNIIVAIFVLASMDSCAFLKEHTGFGGNKAEQYYNLGDVYVQHKDYRNAVKSYQKAISINPDYAAAYYEMGIAYDKWGNIPSAIEAINKAIELKSDYTEARAYLQMLTEKQNK
ncbi:MAG: tetratricopeptide repeat protein [Tannerella sp.]|jgi:tetratricopeptide (TPR) repeat protein|nr:tetratricopeptide repeat protein [Tannerella sp.]